MEDEADDPTATSAPTPPWRNVRIASALLGLCLLIGVNVAFIAKMTAERASQKEGTALPTASAAPTFAPRDEPQSEGVDTALGVDPAQGVDTVPGLNAEQTAPVDEFADEDGGEPQKPEVSRHYRTVQEAAQRSCTTASVEGLSRQIIGEVRCANPNAFAPLPSRPNLSLGSQVFPYLAAPARDRLVRVLDAHRGDTLIINSALRTVAQQYLVWRWSGNRRCGVPLATAPGDSNHESGLALDIVDEAKWRPALEAEYFKWLGASDKVHFDYKGRGATSQNKADVLAFQRLWNRNNPKDAIPADGRYSPVTEERLKKAPPDGFPIGPSCEKRKPTK